MANQSYSAFDGRDPVFPVEPRKRPYAQDWQTINDKGVEYSASIGRYWFNGALYDERSASHNGLVGIGSRLASMIRAGDEDPRP